jgi:hypothetical protein
VPDVEALRHFLFHGSELIPGHLIAAKPSGRPTAPPDATLRIPPLL